MKIRNIALGILANRVAAATAAEEMRPNEWKQWDRKKDTNPTADATACGDEKRSLRQKNNVFRVPTQAELPIPGNIVGGSAVNPKRKYGFFAYLNGCGGSLVASNVVLSAGHCVGVSDYVTLGMHQLLMDPTEVCEFTNLEHIPIKSSVRHYDYTGNPPDNDFWIIKLEWSTQKYGDYIVKLDTPMDGLDLDDGEDHVLTVMGFGTLTSSGSTPNVMQEVNVDYIPNESCGSYSSDEITTNMLCAGLAGKDSCQGDSGGPIIDFVTQKQVGIVSWGYGCADPEYPGVYARVSVGYNWINTYINLWAADVPPPSNGGCIDNPEGWFDSDGPKYTCVWYAAQRKACSQYGNRFSNGGLTANSACCACGGGTTLQQPMCATPTKAPTQRPTDPTKSPTSVPTKGPTKSPMPEPTAPPVHSPTENPVDCYGRFQTPPPGGNCFVVCCNQNGCWENGSKNGQCK